MSFVLLNHLFATVASVKALREHRALARTITNHEHNSRFSRKGAKARRSENDSHYNRRQALILEPVALKHAVVRNNAQFLDARLSDEHAIEWIPMNVGQASGG
jgi:hypothetical protein